MKTLITLGVIGVLILFAGLTFMGSYNSLVKQNVVVDNAWADVESQYQRRFDLIPNLVAATKGFLNQEQTVFGDIAEARTRYSNAESGSNEQVQAANQTESALARLMVIVENYPELQSNRTIQSLMDELSGTENRINIARDRYNAQVGSYNSNVSQFPTNVIAMIFGFEKRSFFQSNEDAANAPTVDLELDSDK